MEESLIHGLAIQYALGVLPGADADAFERHLAEGCTTCQSALNEFGPAPSSDVRDRLMSRARMERKWRPAGVPGVEARILSYDKDRNYVTTLLRMAPGASYPRHKHTEIEECFVLEGDVRVGEVTYRAGDYQRQEAGSVHEIQSTHGGCTLLIMASRHDEVL